MVTIIKSERPRYREDGNEIDYNNLQKVDIDCIADHKSLGAKLLAIGGIPRFAMVNKHRQLTELNTQLKNINQAIVNGEYNNREFSVLVDNLMPVLRRMTEIHTVMPDHILNGGYWYGSRDLKLNGEFGALAQGVTQAITRINRANKSIGDIDTQANIIAIEQDDFVKNETKKLRKKLLKKVKDQIGSVEALEPGEIENKVKAKKWPSYVISRGKLTEALVEMRASILDKEDISVASKCLNKAIKPNTVVYETKRQGVKDRREDTRANAIMETQGYLDSVVLATYNVLKNFKDIFEPPSSGHKAQLFVENLPAHPRAKLGFALVALGGTAGALTIPVALYLALRNQGISQMNPYGNKDNEELIRKGVDNPPDPYKAMNEKLKERGISITPPKIETEADRMLKKELAQITESIARNMKGVPKNATASYVPNNLSGYGIDMGRDHVDEGGVLILSYLDNQTKKRDNISVIIALTNTETNFDNLKQAGFVDSKMTTRDGRSIYMWK